LVLVFSRVPSEQIAMRVCQKNISSIARSLGIFARNDHTRCLRQSAHACPLDHFFRAFLQDSGSRDSRWDGISDGSYLRHWQKKYNLNATWSDEFRLRAKVHSIASVLYSGIIPFLHPALISFSFVHTRCSSNTRHGARIIRVKRFRTVPKYDVVYSTAVQGRGGRLLRSVYLQRESLVRAAWRVRDCDFTRSRKRSIRMRFNRDS